MNGSLRPRILVAGIGNIFFCDDAFGPEVIGRLLSDGSVTDAARIEDYGIRGLHLAYELVSGYDAAVLVDTVARNEPPGTLFVIEPEMPERLDAPDAHRMDLSNVFALVGMIGGAAPPITIVGCQPATVNEGMELSPEVARAVEAALPLVRRVVADLARNLARASRMQPGGRSAVNDKEQTWSEASS